MSENNDEITEHEGENNDIIQNDPTDSADNNESLECTENDATSDDGENNDLLKLEAALDHDALNDITKKILEHFKENDTLEIDASALEDANTACIQAFISMNRYAITNNKSLKWLSPSNSFVDSFNTLGLYSEMMQMEMA